MPARPYEESWMGWDDQFLKSQLQAFYSEQEPPANRREAVLRSAFLSLAFKNSFKRKQGMPRLNPEFDGLKIRVRAWSLALLAGGFSVRR